MKTLLLLEIALQPLDMPADRLKEVETTVIEQGADLIEPQPELPQREDPVEPSDIPSA